MDINKMIEEFYREEFGHLVKIVSNRAGGDYNAEDVVQMAFEKALKHKHSFNPDIQEFRPWFNGILNNALRDFKNDERVSGMSCAKEVKFNSSQKEFDECLVDGVEIGGLSSDMVKKIKKLMEAKAVITRQILFLYYFRQYRPREISEVVPATNGYIRLCVSRFKKELVERLGGEYA